MFQIWPLSLGLAFFTVNDTVDWNIVRCSFVLSYSPEIMISFEVKETNAVFLSSYNDQRRNTFSFTTSV
uniref:Secreted protein n=1 Tax=Rhizophora mucronata TaxID=61149 RepID=A0A2P2L0Z9_RHIMU